MQFAIYTALLLSFVTSSLAYLVNVPNDNEGWNAWGPGHIEWSRVDTDPTGFAVILTNQDRTVLPEDIVIASWIDGRSLETDIWPSNGPFPTGNHFRVNFVKDDQDPHTIYAQSSEFSIEF